MTHSSGDELTEFAVKTVSADTIRQWSLFLGDPNPIHLDSAAVKEKGLGDRVISQGPANLAYVMNMLAESFPGGRIEKMESRFLDNVRAGDSLKASGRVTDVDGDRIECETELSVEEGAVVMKGTATIRLPR